MSTYLHFAIMALPNFMSEFLYAKQSILILFLENQYYRIRDLHTVKAKDPKNIMVFLIYPWHQLRGFLTPTLI